MAPQLVISPSPVRVKDSSVDSRIALLEKLLAAATAPKKPVFSPIYLVDAETRCHARVEKAYDVSDAEDPSVGNIDGIAFLRGFRWRINLEAQCSSPSVAGSNLCACCSEKKMDLTLAGVVVKPKKYTTKLWQGYIGQEPPAWSHYAGSEWARTVWSGPWSPPTDADSPTSSTE